MGKCGRIGARFGAFFLALLAQVGCMLPAPLTQQEIAHDAELKQVADVPITCVRGTECEAKWARAVTWVQDHCPWRIQHLTDSTIITYGPAADERTAYTVQKTPIGADSYQIIMRASCGVQDMLIPHRDICVPKLLDSLAAFQLYVNQH